MPSAYRPAQAVYAVRRRPIQQRLRSHVLCLHLPVMTPRYLCLFPPFMRASAALRAIFGVTSRNSAGFLQPFVQLPVDFINPLIRLLYIVFPTVLICENRTCSCPDMKIDPDMIFRSGRILDTFPLSRFRIGNAGNYFTYPVWAETPRKK